MGEQKDRQGDAPRLKTRNSVVTHFDGNSSTRRNVGCGDAVDIRRNPLLFSIVVNRDMIGGASHHMKPNVEGTSPFLLCDAIMLNCKVDSLEQKPIRNHPTLTYGGGMNLHYKALYLKPRHCCLCLLASKSSFTHHTHLVVSYRFAVPNSKTMAA